jgi:hypothetical protein
VGVGTMDRAFRPSNVAPGAFQGPSRPIPAGRGLLSLWGAKRKQQLWRRIVTIAGVGVVGGSVRSSVVLSLLVSKITRKGALTGERVDHH